MGKTIYPYKVLKALKSYSEEDLDEIIEAAKKIKSKKYHTLHLSPGILKGAGCIPKLHDDAHELAAIELGKKKKDLIEIRSTSDRSENGEGYDYTFTYRILK